MIAHVTHAVSSRYSTQLVVHNMYGNGRLRKCLLNCDSKLRTIPQFFTFDINFKIKCLTLSKKTSNPQTLKPSKFSGYNFKKRVRLSKFGSALSYHKVHLRCKKWSIKEQQCFMKFQS